MAITYDIKPTREQVRNGGDWRNVFTLNVTVTDPADPDFVPFTVSGKGVASTPEERETLMDRIVAKIETKINNRASDVAAFGNIADTVNAYLIANVGV